MRKKIKGRLESAISDRLKERLKMEYTEKDRDDKRNFTEEKAVQQRRPLRMVGARSYTPSRRCWQFQSGNRKWGERQTGCVENGEE